MKSKQFIITCCGAALFCLWIPYWYAPFLFCCLLAYLFKHSIRFQWMYCGSIFFVIGCLYGIYSQKTGSEDLVNKLSSLFGNISPVGFILLSAFVFSMTAMMGSLAGSTIMNGLAKKS